MRRWDRCSTGCVRRSDRPTLVIVTGDHGEGLGDHGEATHGVFAYEATLRIPLIVAQLGGASGVRRAAGRGAASSEPVQHVDILPTILDALGIAVARRRSRRVPVERHS